MRVTTPAGDPAWLVVAHEEAKIAFSDTRFGYYVHDDPANAPRMTDAALHAAPMGGVDFEAESVRLRRLMAPGFTPKRTRLLEGWIQELTDSCLDDMQAAHDRDPAAPVDYHDLLGYKLPVLVICALLGVPGRAPRLRAGSLRPHGRVRQWHGPVRGDGGAPGAHARRHRGQAREPR